MFLIPLYLLAASIIPSSAPQVSLVSDTIAAELPISPVDLTTLEGFYAHSYGVSFVLLSEIVQCESANNQYAEKIDAREDSLGYVQINLREHKNITAAEAFSPFFALNYLASNLADGNASMWTCYGIVSNNGA